MRRAHWETPIPILTHEQLEEQIIQYLRLLGWVTFRTHFGAKYMPIIPGWPDVVAFKEGRTIFIEVKVGRDRVKPKQAAIALLLRNAGIPVVEARSLDDVMSVAA